MTSHDVCECTATQHAATKSGSRKQNQYFRLSFKAVARMQVCSTRSPARTRASCGDGGTSRARRCGVHPEVSDVHQGRFGGLCAGRARSSPCTGTSTGRVAVSKTASWGFESPPGVPDVSSPSWRNGIRAALRTQCPRDVPIRVRGKDQLRCGRSGKGKRDPETFKREIRQCVPCRPAEHPPLGCNHRQPATSALDCASRHSIHLHPAGTPSRFLPESGRSRSCRRHRSRDARPDGS
jgi:hypothetical protein